MIFPPIYGHPAVLGRDRVELATCWSRVRRPNQLDRCLHCLYTTKLKARWSNLERGLP